MRAKGTIYQVGQSGTHGDIFLFIPILVRIIIRLFRGFGAGLIAFAVLTFSFSLGPVVSQEFNYLVKERLSFLNLRNSNFLENSIFEEAEASEEIKVQKEAQSFGVNSYFSVVIPKIGAKANIIANVEVNDPSEYLEALKRGVAHSKGTFFPGQSGRIFLFSHSTDSPLNFARYNAVFYLLRKLEKKDEIWIFFANKKYEYEVVDKVIAEADDTSWLEPKFDEEELVLMTCDPPGTNWRRLLVIAKPKLDN